MSDNNGSSQKKTFNAKKGKEVKIKNRFSSRDSEVQKLWQGETTSLSL